MLLLVLMINIDAIFASVKQINILHISDGQNTIADVGLNFTLSKVEGRYYLKKVVGFNTQYENFLASLCSTYAEMVNEGNPPHLIIDNTLYGMVSLGTKAFTVTMGIPTISTSFGSGTDLGPWSDTTDYQKRNLIHFNPPRDLIPEIVRQIVIVQNYSTAAVLVDDFYEIEHKYKSLLENVATRHIITYINITHTIQQLIGLKANNIFNIFVVGSLEHIKIVLDGAEAIGYFSERFSWYAITHESGLLQCECSKAKVFFANAVNRESEFELVPSLSNKFFYYLTYHAFNATWKMYNSLEHRNETYIKCEDYNGSNAPNRTSLDLRSFFMNEMNTNSKVKFLKPIPEHSIKMLFTMNLFVVTFRESTRYRTETVGRWRGGFEDEMNLTKPQVVAAQASRIVYRIVTKAYPPFVYENPKAPKGYSGYCIDLINEIAQIMSFDYQIMTVVDNQMGRLIDGKWDGLINELMANRADIALSALSVTTQRESVIDFTTPYYDLIGHSILMKLHKTPTSLFRFLEVFDSGIWFAIIVIYFATSFYMWILYKLSPFGEKFVKSTDRKIRHFNLLECMWFSVVSVTVPGGGESPVNSSSRIIAASWWFFCFIMISSYSANLAAFLTVSRLNSPIDDLEGLVHQYEISYSTLNDSDTMRYFERMANIEYRLFLKWQDMNIFDKTITEYDRAQLGVFEYPLSDRYTKIWKNMESVGFSATVEEGLEKLRNSPSPGKGFAFMLDAIDAQYLALTNCDLEVVDEFFKRPMALAVQKGSTLKDQLNSVILDLSNKRVLAKLKDKWWTKNPHRSKCDNRDEVEGVDVDNIGGVFICLVTAISIVIITSIANYVIDKRKSNKVIVVEAKKKRISVVQKL